MMALRCAGRVCAPALLGSRMLSTEARRLEGRVALVTASTAGIGRAIAERLGREGARVMLCSRKSDNVKKAVEEMRKEGIVAEGSVCHVGKSEDRKAIVEATVAKLGGLDILVSNAGTNMYVGPLLGVGEDQWDKIFENNVKAGMFLAKEAYPHLQTSKYGGSIVYVSSIAAYRALEGLGPYSVSKTALLGLVSAMAMELGPRGVRVNGVAPGIVKTAFSSMLWQEDDKTQRFSKHIPLRSLALPEQIAGAVAFLASDDASYVTGETLPVAGGMQSHL